MKKACVYILLPFLLLNSSLNEFFKVPALYSHYLEHRSLDQQINLLDFLAMHYIGDDMNSTDQDKDMQLPFKKMDGPDFEILLSPAKRPDLEKKQSFPVHHTSLFDPQDFYLTCPASGDLFRPPIA